MNASLLLRMSIARLLRFRLQAILMSIGIVISVCATTFVALALMNMRDRFTVHFSRLYPTDSIVVATAAENEHWDAEGVRLTLKEIDTIRASVKNLADWDPMVISGQRVVRIGPNASMALIVGNSERAELIRNRGTSEGEYFSESDVGGRARVALIGSSIAATLFLQESPVGQQISIDGVAFKVKGVLEKIGLDPHGNDQDDIIQVPYTTLMEQVMKVDSITSVTFVLSDPTRMKTTARQISDVLHESHPYGAAGVEQFLITTPVDVQQRLDKSFLTIQTFVLLAAAIGFALSGAVIAMVMAMSVRARRAEIGLRKAIGARTIDVQWQLLIETVLVVVAASLVGLLLAKLIIVAMAPFLVDRYGLVIHRTPVLLIATVVATALVTAVLSALLIARRAARLDPGSWLRQQ